MMFDLLARQQQESDGRPKAVLQQVIGTVLVCIGNAVKYDQSLGNEWSKQFKAVAPCQLSPFLLHLMLAMSRHHR